MSRSEAGGDQLARLLLPYCRRGLESPDGPDHEAGWWFTGAPPAAARDALTLVIKELGERPNDQPPEDWLVDRAELCGGVLAGYAAPADPDGPRMRVDAIIVPATRARGLAGDIARLWPTDWGGTALDLAIVEGLASIATDRVLWAAPGPGLNAGTRNWVDAAFCRFWWD